MPSDNYRTHTCGELTATDSAKKVILSGWVHRRRDHGELIFIDLRDRYGLTQIVFDPTVSKEAHHTAESLRPEYVIKVEGQIRKRPTDMINKKMATGEIELLVASIIVLNKSQTPPFEIDQETPVGEELRLEYRYLDLRRQHMRDHIILRHRIIKFIRDFLDKKDFLEIETPILVKGTPEGAREFMVPSRLHPGHFYVLPQSPQQLKQLLMVAGMDKYFQIARCFRDEDQRGDRQPEFTQLDLEMSFVTQKDVLALNEQLLIELLTQFSPQKKIVKKPFPVLTYAESMLRFGVDNPDLRYDLEIKDISGIVAQSDFQVFTGALKNGGVVRALRVPDASKFTRKDITELEDVAKVYKARGLAYLTFTADGIKGPILKFLKEKEIQLITKKTGAKSGDIVFFGADSVDVVCASLGHVRIECAHRLHLINEDIYSACWIVDFPMFKKNTTGEEAGYAKDIAAMHHPFTRPQDDSLDTLTKDPLQALATAYDLVLNGNEIAGGSLRIHEEALQEKVFKILQLTKEEAQAKFSHLLRAFTYGAPPHGGIAWGLDRLIMLLAGADNIREVIAFPKDQRAKDLMIGTPTTLPKSALSEVHISTKL